MGPPPPLLDSDLRRLLGRLKLVYRRARATGGGQRRGAEGAGRLEFSDYRDYEPGDDPRDLDWSAYARLDRLVVKEYERAARQPVTLLLDASASMAIGAPDRWRYARRLILALGYLALLGRHQLRIALVGGDFPLLGPYDRPESIDELAGALGTLSASPDDTPLVESLGRKLRRLGRAGSFVLVSDLWSTAPLEPALLSFQRQGRMWTAIHLLTADEMDPTCSGPTRLEAPDGEARELVVDGTTRAAYRRELATYLDRWRAFCSRYDIGYARIDTGMTMEQALLGELRSRGVVG